MALLGRTTARLLRLSRNLSINELVCKASRNERTFSVSSKLSLMALSGFTETQLTVREAVMKRYSEHRFITASLTVSCVSVKPDSAMSDNLDETEKVRSFLDALQTSSLMLRFLDNRNRRAVVRPSNAIAHSTLKTILLLDQHAGGHENCGILKLLSELSAPQMPAMPALLWPN